MTRWKTLPDLFDAACERHPDAVALVWDDELITYRQMMKQAEHVAGGLKARGFGPGDRIAFWLPNVPAYVVLLIACARLGVAAVAVNTRFGPGEVSDIVRRSGARALALWPDFGGLASDAVMTAIDATSLPRLEALIEVGGGAVRAGGWENAPRIPLESLLAADTYEGTLAMPDADCVTFTTSGTTSAPKIVVQPQHAIAHHAQDVAAAFGFGPRTVSLQALPLCGVFGFAQAMAVLASGGRLVMLAKWDGERAAGLIRQWEVDSLFASDDMVQRLLDTGQDFPSLNFIGHAAFNTALADIAERADTRGITLRGLYGMSECMALYSVRPLAAPVAERKKGGGTPVSPEARVRVTDPDTGETLPIGETGALEVAGPSLFARYEGNPEASAAAFTADGFFRTGDLARLEPDGAFEFLGRMGDVLRLGGFLVNPAEIEEHLQAHPSVRAAQVVAIGTAQGMRPVAFIIPADGQTLDDAALLAHCAPLARYKQPVRFIGIEAFPVTESANGVKIRRTELRRMAESELPPDKGPEPPQVVAVSRQREHKFSKANVAEISLVAGLGVEGDAHQGAAVKHRSRVAANPDQPNLRQVHLIHQELLEELHRGGFDVRPGAMGENITTQGIALLDLPRGTRLLLGETAIIEITGLRNPCAQLDKHRSGLMKALLDRTPDGTLIRKAGIMAIVIEGGVVKPGDPIRIDLPPPPHQRLEPV
ncbi:AMP-binding protein [Iodidimonas sp. SYSU 1G8]|uniref:AMP-binding protein n=1 Tax=Iodidimonas sp. SYSU 1G8 TaxID=3133967 RepID=UPI0031FEF2E0